MQNQFQTHQTAHASSSPLIQITENDGVIFDIKYATEDNFSGVKVYNDTAKRIAYIHKDAYDLFKNAIKIATDMGYKFVIFDIYRPLEVQKFFYDHFKKTHPEMTEEELNQYVTNPETSLATHTRGVAIDLTIEGLDMGTEFDDFSNKAHHGNIEINSVAQKNRLILKDIMEKSGFSAFQTEWWHYQLPNFHNYKKLTEIEAGVKMSEV